MKDADQDLHVKVTGQILQRTEHHREVVGLSYEITELVVNLEFSLKEEDSEETSYQSHSPPLLVSSETQVFAVQWR